MMLKSKLIGAVLVAAMASTAQAQDAMPLPIAGLMDYAQIAEITVKAGDTVKAGETLVRFVCARQKAAFRDLKREYEFKKMNGSDPDMSALSIAQAALIDCSISAPFDGVVVSVDRRQHEVVLGGSQILSLTRE